MTFVLADRVKETTTTTGTGTLNLAGAVTDYQGFVAAIGTANTTYYCCVREGGDEWEVGTGTVTDGSPDTLERTTVLASSNAGSLVNFLAGTKTVYVTRPEGTVLYQDGDDVTQIGDGGVTNYMEIRADGEISLKGTARVTKQLLLPLSDMQRSGPNPPENTEDNFLTVDFDKNSVESLYFKPHSPADYASGTDIAIHVDFFVDTVDTGTQRAIVWKLEYKVVEHGDVFDFSSGTTTVSDTHEIPTDTADKEVLACDDLVAAGSDLTGDGKLLCHLYRDATHSDDDHDGDVRVVSIHYNYVSDKLGTAT